MIFASSPKTGGEMDPVDLPHLRNILWAHLVEYTVAGSADFRSRLLNTVFPLKVESRFSLYAADPSKMLAGVPHILGA